MALPSLLPALLACSTRRSHEGDAHRALVRGEGEGQPSFTPNPPMQVLCSLPSLAPELNRFRFALLLPQLPPTSFSALLAPNLHSTVPSQGTYLELLDGHRATLHLLALDLGRGRDILLLQRDSRHFEFFSWRKRAQMLFSYGEREREREREREERAEGLSLVCASARGRRWRRGSARGEGERGEGEEGKGEP